MNNTEIKALVNNLVLNALDSGLNPWQKPWVGGTSNRPRNGITGRAYRGVNIVLLGLAARQKKYTSNRWVTFKQANAAGGGVKPGEKATKIVFWTFREIEKETGKTKIPLLRVFSVFNEEQTGGVSFKAEKQSQRFNGTKIENAEKIIAGMKNPPALCIENSAEAYYSASTDTVVCPEIAQYPNPDEYYRTIFHELGHSTGHSKRLGRFSDLERKPSYGKEELIAEMTAAILAMEAGVNNEDSSKNSASYLAGWARKIRADADLVLSAAGMAQKAASWILGETDSDEEPEEGAAI